MKFIPRVSQLSRYLGFAISTLIILSGCVSPPTSELQIKELDSSTLGLSESQSPRVADGWWKVFGDAQLNSLIDDSLSNSPSLNEALIRVRGAQAQAIAAGAALKPGFALDADETYQRLSENYIYPPKEAGLGVAGGDKV